jgi:hypothetical protein
MWLYIPSVFVPAAADLNSESNWRFQALASSAGLNGKPSPARSWYHAWKRASWMQLLCGQMCEPSTASRGVEWWMSSLRGSRASRSARRVADAAQTIRDTCGRQFLESSLSLARLLSFLRTSPASSQLPLFSTDAPSATTSLRLTQPRNLRRALASVGISVNIVNAYTGDFSENTEYPFSSLSSATWNDWVIGARRLSSLRRKWAQATRGSGYSFSEWQTPNPPRGRENDQATRGQSKGDKSSLKRESAQWKTPHGHGNRDKKGKVGGAGGGEFAKQANQWGTPGVHSGPDASPNSQRESDLREQVKMWPTMTAKDSDAAGARTNPGLLSLTQVSRCFPLAPQKSSDGPQCSNDGQNLHQLWSTVRAADAAGVYYQRDQHQRGKERLSLLGQAEGLRSKKRLNPLFVRWLMGWPLWEPIDGIGSDSLEMEWCRFKQRMRLAYLSLAHSASSRLS